VWFYTIFLSVMCALFVLSATLLLGMAVAQIFRKRGHRAAVYLGLTLLACVVAAGFYFFRRLI
jgi:Na+/melibiose symporter-like transporter